MCKAFWIAALLAATAGPALAAPHALHYLRGEDVAPARVLPPPPAPESPQAQAELAMLHKIVDGATPARLAQARWDQDHEDPAIFDPAVGLTLERLPHSWALLQAVREEASAAAAMSKAYYNRTRPWAIDPRLASCEHAPEHKPMNSYPSGHAILAFSVGYVLAELIPAQAEAIQARASDYAYSRLVCGVHFPSDIEASHALAMLVAVKLLANPRFAAEAAVARAELVDALRHLKAE